MNTPKQERARVVELNATEDAVVAAQRRQSIASRGEPLDGEPTLADSLRTLVEHRALIACVTLSALLLGVAYILLAAPTYRSDVLLQVEDKAKSIAGLDDLSSMFSDKAPADAEMEIIRSRSLLGGVVDELNLTIEAKPRFFPVIGGAFYRHHDEGGIASAKLGMASFAWGGERINVSRLHVPDELLDQRLRLIAGDGHQFTLEGPSGKRLLSGEVGKAVSAGDGEGRIEIFVADIQARPGTQFRVIKRRRFGVIDDLQHDLRIAEKGKKTGILTVALDGKDAKQVAAIVDSIARLYVRQNVERKSAEAAKTLEFLQQQLPELKRNVDAADAAFNAYQVRKGSVDLTLETQALVDRAVEIDKALSEMELSRADLRQRFTDNHPIFISMRQKESKLRAERASIDAKMRGLPEQELDSARLTRDSKVAGELYFLLVNKSQELNVVKSGAVGNVRVLDMAVVPYEPISPKKALTLALSLCVGLALGGGLAFVRKAFDRGVQDPAEIEATTGLSIYATVPHSPREAELARGRTHDAVRYSVLAAVDPSDIAVESLRSARTALQFALADAPNSIVSVCGPSPGVGKSFLAANLAHVIATGGQRVLLIDADLRRGRLHRYIGGNKERGPGLSEVITGQCSIAEATRTTAAENLSFLATGKLPPNPSELVGSPRFVTFLADASSLYDLVVIDTPPILAVTDAALVGQHAGVNLLALRSGRHAMREILLAINRFRDTGVRVHGIVLNDVHVAAGGNHYHYHYEYRTETKDG